MREKLLHASDDTWLPPLGNDKRKARAYGQILISARWGTCKCCSHGPCVDKQNLQICLQTLKNVIDIQQKYPNIEVATKTRQAARKTLNKALDALHELHDGGLLDDKQFAMLYEVSLFPSDHPSNCCVHHHSAFTPIGNSGVVASAGDVKLE
ncbi:hypothetical protein HPB48_022097 [Haemaphysalis longicornis]|uniref:Uncharacterized protein n=1 Tax=Haemaphysalis longicornis TaxID=44386 RepID=A0A9J6FU40_HAELO|nr:hypothetical protein HPB48_022097 [Haemaphysalis longicornis]